jgi:hypothetical protein
MLIFTNPPPKVFQFFPLRVLYLFPIRYLYPFSFFSWALTFFSSIFPFLCSSSISCSWSFSFFSSSNLSLLKCPTICSSWRWRNVCHLVGSSYTSNPDESWELSKCSSTWGGNLISSMSCLGSAEGRGGVTRLHLSLEEVKRRDSDPRAVNRA